MPIYLTIHELALRWRYKTDSKVYKMKKKIGFTRIEGKILFDLEDVKRYEDKNKFDETAGNVENC